MSKNINVQAHVKRYQNTELSDVVRLIVSLQDLVESRRGEKVAQLKEQLAILEKGEIPEEQKSEEITPRTTRGGRKKIVADDTEA